MRTSQTRNLRMAVAGVLLATAVLTAPAALAGAPATATHAVAYPASVAVGVAVGGAQVQAGLVTPDDDRWDGA